MIANTLFSPADACAPDADRAGLAMPENLARLLCIVRILLDSGRRFTALVERRMSWRGFWLLSAVWGTSRPAMRARLHRGLLRAAALESLLLCRAATGRDVAAPPSPVCPEATQDAKLHPCDEPFRDQVARLDAERARYDAAPDPRNPPTPGEIEAEVRARSIARTIDDIRRDLGVVAIMCTNQFWDAMTDAIARYQDGTAAERLDDTLPEPEPLPPPPKDESDQRQMGRGPDLCPRRKPAFKTGDHTIVPFPARPALARPRQNVPISNINAAVPHAATGPPRVAMRLAA